MPTDSPSAPAPTSGTDHTVRLAAGTIAYRSFGPDDGQPVVFVHGLLVDGSLWHQAAARLGDQGFRAITPDWPLGSHRQAMEPDADLSPRGVARIVLEFLAALDLDHVTLVGNDTGGAICQFVIDTDPTPVDRLVLTNCDAFETFPPAAFKPMFWMGKVPGLLTLFMQGGRLGFVRDRVGYGPLITGRPDPELTRAWGAPFLSDRGVRRDTRKLTAQVRPRDLADVGTRFGRFDRPVLLCWGAKDPFFKLKLAHRLQEAFPDARLVELEARTFVSLDQPERLAQEIAAFAAVSAGGS